MMKTKVTAELVNNQLRINGQPCEHPGCLNHRTHPCEVCGRIAGVENKESTAVRNMLKKFKLEKELGV